LLDAVETEGRGFRLTGVGVAQFESARQAAVQLDLLAPAAGPPRGAALQAVLSAVRERYGHQALFPAEAGPSGAPCSTAGRAP
jgi:DNA polymerase-4